MTVVRRFSMTCAIALIGSGAWLTSSAAQTPVAVTAGQELRVMSYNIKHARGNDDCVNPTAEPETVPEAECEIDLPRVAGVIQASGATIVGLQEVDRFWARSGNVDQPAELASLLGMNVCYGANLDHPADDHGEQPHQYGTAVLSTFPIVECNNTFLPTPEDWEQRGALAATIELDNGQQVLMINAHLQASREDEEEESIRQRTEQMAGVLEIASQSEIPVIITGDLNATPGSDELAAVEDEASGFTDTWAVIHPDEDGFTRPAGPDIEPEVRIDYILVDDSFAVQGAEVLNDDLTRIAADHFPVVADITPVNGTDSTPIATPVT